MRERKVANVSVCKLFYKISVLFIIFFYYIMAGTDFIVPELNVDNINTEYNVIGLNFIL